MPRRRRLRPCLTVESMWRARLLVRSSSASANDVAPGRVALRRKIERCERAVGPQRARERHASSRRDTIRAQREPHERRRVLEQRRHVGRSNVADLIAAEVEHPRLLPRQDDGADQLGRRGRPDTARTQLQPFGARRPMQRILEALPAQV